MLSAQGRHADAEPIQRELVELWTRARGPDDRYTMLSTYNHANTLVLMGRFAEAEPLFAAMSKWAAAAQIPPAQAAVFIARHGPCLVRLERYADAEAPLREAHRRLGETGQARGPRMSEVLVGLAIVCERTNRPEEAARWRAQLQSISSTTPSR
jgi:hypothetical protein